VERSSTDGGRDLVVSPDQRSNEPGHIGVDRKFHASAICGQANEGPKMAAKGLCAAKSKRSRDSTHETTMLAQRVPHCGQHSDVNEHCPTLDADRAELPIERAA
jgi:hypothetical protein